MNAVESGQLCKSAEQAIRHGVGNLSHVPGLIKKIISNRAWENREVGPNRFVKLNSLSELITAKPMDGWGEDPKKVESLIRDDAEVLRMWHEAMKQKRGPKASGNNHNIVMEISGTKQGNNRSYTLTRLERERPDLFRKVADKKLSANAAAIKAGFRVKTVSVRVDPKSAARTIRNHFSDEQICELTELLRGGTK